MKITTIFLVPILLLLVSCETNPAVEPTDDNLDINTAEIYYRWAEDLNCYGSTSGSFCRESLASLYNNSHPDIPNNAVKNKYYGPVSSGKYTIVIPRAETGTTVTLERNLIAPEKGFRRYYTDSLKNHNRQVNRCVFKMGHSGLSYIDEPIN